MTNRPRLRLGSALAPGLLAVGLFGVMALIVVNTGFADMEGFPDGIAITSELGYAMFGFEALHSTEGAIAETEPFLVSVILIAIVLDAALDASLVLAKREDAGEPVAALSSTSRAPNRGTGLGSTAERTFADGGESAEPSEPDGEPAETDSSGGDDR